MVILGLGSNLGDRLAHLRQALLAIKRISNITVEQVSPLYISDALLPENAPSSWDQPYINLALRCHTPLSPLELLTHIKSIEHSIGRKPEKRHWGPRVIDIDILAWDSMIYHDDRLTLPHRDLSMRPFALWPLADVAPEWIHPTYQQSAAEIVALWGSRFTGEAPLHTRQIPHRIDTSQLVGVLNVTPDSFSDGGNYLDIEKALEHAQCLVASGAEIIDVGAESTRPNAHHPLNHQEEWQRLEPILSALKDPSLFALLQPKISVDTRHAETAKKAIAAGVNWINDVTGLTHPNMCQCIAESSVDCVVMHHITVPVDPKQTIPLHQDPVDFLYQWGKNKIAELEQAGIASNRVVLDVGIGFGKTAYQSLVLLKHIRHFKSLGTRLLIGHSRKSFMQLFTARPIGERDIETMAITLYLADQGVDYLRVHNVDMCARGLKVVKALA
ncbi:MAG: hypothetical protein A3E83_02505 [Gammaproteobacteria bacterium RIFCSPHIGHO2_12_FULL_41_20]|nr:MAG: hypothetical protein A3E83_02505 [Gammaproteobacteria bacterium RIFCSPHIGHO2_12_FULL_41_20]